MIHTALMLVSGVAGVPLPNLQQSQRARNINYTISLRSTEVQPPSRIVRPCVHVGIRTHAWSGPRSSPCKATLTGLAHPKTGDYHVRLGYKHPRARLGHPLPLVQNVYRLLHNVQNSAASITVRLIIRRTALTRHV
jgi:hypothetical protein